MAVGVAFIPSLFDVITIEYGSHRNGSDRALSGRGLIPYGVSVSSLPHRGSLWSPSRLLFNRFGRQG